MWKAVICMALWMGLCLASAAIVAADDSAPEQTDGDVRRSVSDPIADMRDVALNQWLKLFEAADADADGSLTSQEWPGKEVAAVIPALVELEFNTWDHNGNGLVDREEGRWLCDLAYGLTRPSGKPLRTPTGTVLAWYYTRNLDKNHDDVLSRDEFVAGHHLGKEQNADVFTQRDANHNGVLDDGEMATLFWGDVSGFFRAYDTDRDGAVNDEEMVHGAAWGVSVSRRCVTAFDADGDGTLSFREFRTTPVANQMSNWWRPRQDTDHDRRLSWQEFYLEDSPVMIGLSRFMFDRFDLDRDGFLSFQEFEFITDFRWFSPEVSCKEIDIDRDGFVSESELAARTGRSAIEIKRDVKLFDLDGDGRLDAGELAGLPTVTAPEKRGTTSDPFFKLLDRYDGLIEKHWADWDAEANGSISLEEFNQGMIDALQLPPNALTTLADFNRDGVISRDEARLTLECLFGIRRSDVRAALVMRGAGPGRGVGLINLNPRPMTPPREHVRLRTPGGAVVDLVQFQTLDRDRSGTIDRAEFNVLKTPAAERAAHFAGCDKNGNGQLSLEEWAKTAFFDPANDFRYLDANYDAFLDREELLKRTDWRQKIAKHLLPGFDLDGDGRLSLTEYRLTPLASPVMNWYVNIVDLDGKLTFDEFPGAGEFGLLRLHAFECFDVDGNGTLDVKEFDFRVRATDVFYSLDANGTNWRKLFALDGYPACGSPLVSPDGTTLAFDAWQVTNGVVSRPAAVFHVKIDGADCREICQGQMPSWSPDGKRFVCSRTQGGTHIAIMTLDGREEQRVAGGWSGQWSPDGKLIAYGSGNRLMVYEVESGQSRDVLGAANTYNDIFWNCCWSPDSKQICFKAGRRDGRFDVALVAAAGAEHGLKVRYTGASFNPKFAWHPTENRIVFAMHCAERRALQLYQFDPTTNDAPVLAPGQDPRSDNGDPCWTPDGKRLIVTCGSY